MLLVPHPSPLSCAHPLSGVTQMYQLAVGTGHRLQLTAGSRRGGRGPPVGAQAAAARRMLAETGLVRQIISLLSGGSGSGACDGSPATTQRQRRCNADARLLTSCLCLVDIMSDEAACRPLLAEAGWLDAVEPLLESPDAIVRLLAERTLCSMHAWEV